MLLCLGCQSLGPLAQRPPSDGRSWLEQGQEAMRQGQMDLAIACYEQSLAADPTLAASHLSLAAAYLEKGEDAKACPHLHQYLTSHPTHVTVRTHYAELLWRQDRKAEARVEFEQVAAAATLEGEITLGQLVHCHSRLMELAEESEDGYAEHLHRGVGLYLLACQRQTKPDPEGALDPESLLCKAAAELTLAHARRPDQAQPSWYLYAVWSRLDQRQPAVTALQQACATAPFSYLTVHEQNGLELARRSHFDGRLR